MTIRKLTERDRLVFNAGFLAGAASDDANEPETDEEIIEIVNDPCGYIARKDAERHEPHDEET